MNDREVEELQAKYKLTDEERKEYFKNVNLYFTTGIKPMKNKDAKLIFAAGQAGAGKSKLIPILRKNLNNNVVVSDYDMVRAMHPNFDKANKEHPNDVHKALLPDADMANEYLRHYCKDNNYNLIYEGTMRGTKVFLQIANEFKSAGYDIEMALMSVPALESFGDTLRRFALGIKETGRGRYVSKKIHDESYEKFLVTVDELSKLGLVDRADVFRRGSENENQVPQIIYSTENKQFESAVEAIKFGRSKYKQIAIANFEEKFNEVYEILSQYRPQDLAKLRDWEVQYKQEVSYIDR